jgi:enoyl-CoA hydratase
VTSDPIFVEIKENIATIWLNRPEKKNALNLDIWDGLSKEFSLLNQDEKVRCIILAAKGDCFSVGLDLGSMSFSPDTRGANSKYAKSKALYEFIKRLQGSTDKIAKLKVPTIAVIHGYCLGGGLDIVSACDIRIASSDAVFSIRETKMAIVADLGSLQRLPDIIGMARLKELAFTSNDIDAKFAEKIGLVNYVEPDFSSAFNKAKAIAETIAQNSPVAVKGTKDVLLKSKNLTEEQSLDYVATYNAGFLESSDLTEAITAFFQKRKPEFGGN